jgi:hypothetical protein
MAGFKRSGLFGLIGVVVVAIVVAVIAQSSGGGEANPKGTMALIFGVIAVFVVILFVLQRADLEKVAGGDAKAVQRAVAEGGGKIENPTTMDEPQLWAALAVKPIGDEAIKARSSMWDAGRRSQKLGWVVMLLIFLTVPSIYLFESFVPLLIGGPLIAIAAIYGSVRALAPGGELDSGYQKVGIAMALRTVPNSTRWKKLTIEGGPEGIVVTRKGATQADGLCDLWLAERLAGAL